MATFFEILGIVLLFSFIASLMIGGLVISFFTSIGGWMIWFGILIAGFYDNFERVGIPFIIFFFFITLLSTFIDNVTMMVGAKKMGAGKWGILGAILGGLIGLVVGNIIGMIIGPFIGALIFELLFEKKDLKPALKAGFGTFIGFLSAVVIKFGVGVAMISSWLYLWFN